MRELGRRALLGWAGASALATAGCGIADRSFAASVPGTVHALPHEQPGQLRALLTEWLARVERSS